VTASSAAAVRGGKRATHDNADDAGTGRAVRRVRQAKSPRVSPADYPYNGLDQQDDSASQWTLLPLELFALIFANLSLFDLHRAAATCTTWRCAAWSTLTHLTLPAHVEIADALWHRLVSLRSVSIHLLSRSLADSLVRELPRIHACEILDCSACRI
jgi:hypothetical protein